MIKPYIFKFRQPCSTKFKAQNKFSFDPNLDVVVNTHSRSNLPAILEKTNNSLGTKKADLEKGEDQKDSLMWTNS